MAALATFQSHTCSALLRRRLCRLHPRPLSIQWHTHTYKVRKLFTATSRFTTFIAASVFSSGRRRECYTPSPRSVRPELRCGATLPAAGNSMTMLSPWPCSAPAFAHDTTRVQEAPPSRPLPEPSVVPPPSQPPPPHVVKQAAIGNALKSQRSYDSSSDDDSDKEEAQSPEQSPYAPIRRVLTIPPEFIIRHAPPHNHWRSTSPDQQGRVQRTGPQQNAATPRVLCSGGQSVAISAMN